MQVLTRPASPGWALYVNVRLGCVGGLVYDLGEGTRLLVPMPPAKTSLFLALAACRAIDEREGLAVNVGDRSLAELGHLVGVMPGPGNPVAANTIGGYKREITRLIKRAIAKLSVQVGRQLHVPMPIVNRGHGQGYGLADEGLRLVGVCIEELIRAVREAQGD